MEDSFSTSSPLPGKLWLGGKTFILGTRINSIFVQFSCSAEVSLISPLPKNSNNKQQNEL